MSVGLVMGNVRVIGTVKLSLNPVAVVANNCAEQDFTVPGVQAGDLVFINKPSVTAGLGIVNVRAKEANTISVTFVNATAAPIDAGAEDYCVLVIRPEGGKCPGVMQAY